jgi:methyl-accepting chemotaxis protein
MEWFRKYLPVRQKLTLSFGVVIGLLGLPLALEASLLWSAPGLDSLFGVAHGVAMVTGVCAVAALILARSFKKGIADPYVTTVVRMEALAAGDLNSPVQFTDYEDCVGRMTRAMQSFKEAAQARADAEAALANSRSQEQAVDALSDGLQKLATGNFACRIDHAFAAEYEMLRANFNAAVAALQEAILEVSGTSERIRTGSAEISQASDDLARRTEGQAASIEQTALTMDQLSEVVRGAAKSASEAERFAMAASDNAQTGSAVVRDAVRAMAAIEQSSQEIAQIISVIDGIAFQTNLLALNAGVEAARAGESGRGFAVVASEVRALAQRSAESASQIKSLIEKSANQVKDGVDLVSRTGKTFDNILEGVNTTSTLVREIAGSANEQAEGIQKANSAVSEIEKATQQNAAMVEQASAAARSLTSEANQLGELVDRFDVGARPTAPVYAAPAPVARRAAPMPRSHGNLALAPTSDDDWQDF